MSAVKHRHTNKSPRPRRMLYPRYLAVVLGALVGLALLGGLLAAFLKRSYKSESSVDPFIDIRRCPQLCAAGWHQLKL